MSPFGSPARWLLAALIAFGALPAQAQNGLHLDRIALHPGFRIELYARVPVARSLAVAKELGAVFVGTLAQDVYVIRDPALDGRPGPAIKVKDGLIQPNGVAWHDGHLYVAARDRIVRYPGRTMADLVAAAPEVLFYGLPDTRYERARYAAVGPDGHLYVAVNAACNVCPLQGFEGTIVRLPLAGGRPGVFARGVRNSEGLAFQPGTGVLYFTDNGYDGLGDDLPPDEFNRAPRAGLHFGFPWFAGGVVRTPEFERQIVPGRTEPPDGVFPAHSSPAGVEFYDGAQFPAEFRGDAFVALHGSGSSTAPNGFRIVRIRFDDKGDAVGFETFAQGWLTDGAVWGRPVDLEELPDGSLLISDDYAQAVYRVTYAP